MVKKDGKAFFNGKAATVEHLNRTLKTIIWKYFYENEKKKWLHILNDVTYNYNHSIDRGIGMRPKDVNAENKVEVKAQLFGDFDNSAKPRYSIGDIVRVEKYHSGTRFMKGYTINFTEKFKIIAVYRGDPIMYGIQAVDTGEKIKGRFYEWKLSLVK